MFISMQILVFHQEPSAPIAQREPICIFKKAHCVSLGVLWLDVKVGKKKDFFFNVIFYIPKNEISNSVNVFSGFISFHDYFLFTNEKLRVPRSADPQFSNSRTFV